MDVQHILIQLDEYIEQMQRARDIIAGLSPPVITPSTKEVKGRKISEDGKRRIAEAQRQRWAKQKRKKTARKRTMEKGG